MSNQGKQRYFFQRNEVTLHDMMLFVNIVRGSSIPSTTSRICSEHFSISVLRTTACIGAYLTCRSTPQLVEHPIEPSRLVTNKSSMPKPVETDW